MDYAVHDALRAGFGRLVAVIRPEMAAWFETSLAERMRRHIPVAYALQRLEGLPGEFKPPPGRTRPWGTGHAVLAVEHMIHEPFAVLNADDFYGPAAYAAMSDFLQGEQQPDLPAYAVVGYALRETLPDAGPVSRALCRCTPDRWLQEIIEIPRMEKQGAGGRFVDRDGKTRTVGGDELVSMNMWGFTPRVFHQLREGFVSFLRQAPSSSETEFLLPVAINDLIRAACCRVKVLPGGSVWCGMTNPQDKARVARLIRQRVARGEYPQELWA
jgi:UTP-glucose-1-phosphate uridylyltransferase